jgi:hypothetical protein
MIEIAGGVRGARRGASRVSRNLRATLYERGGGQRTRHGASRGRAGRAVTSVLFALVLLTGSCGLLPGRKGGDPAPSATPVTVAPLAPTAGSRLLPTIPPTPTPMPTLTPVPSPTPPSPLAQVEVTGPATYPGGLPYLGAIEVEAVEAREAVVVEAACEGTLLPPGAVGQQTLQAGQRLTFFFLILPGHAPMCRVVVAGQACGEWTITPSGGSEETATMTCVAMGDEP